MDDNIEFNICSDLNIINVFKMRAIAIGKSQSGKTLFISNLLYNKILKTDDDIILIFYTSTLNDYNHIYVMVIFYLIKTLNYVVDDTYPEKLINYLNNFDLQNYLNDDKNQSEFDKNPDKFIKYLLEYIVKNHIEPILIQNNIKKDNVIKKRNVNFYFNNNKDEFSMFLNNIIKKKLVKNRYIHIVIDDLNESIFKKDLKHNIHELFEKGRHKHVTVTFIDQYIRSGKITTTIRTNSNYIFLRSLDASTIAILNEYSGTKLSNTSINIIKQYLKDYYTLILNCDTQTFYIYKTPKTYIDIFSDKNNKIDNLSLNENCSSSSNESSDEE